MDDGNSMNDTTDYPDDDLGTLEPGRIGCIDCISFSPDGETLVIGGGNITLRNATTLELITTASVNDSRVTAVQFSPDGSKIVSGSHDGWVRIWNTALDGLASEKIGDHFGQVPGEPSPVGPTPLHVRSVSWSPDGIYVAAGGGDGDCFSDPSSGLGDDSDDIAKSWASTVAGMGAGATCEQGMIKIWNVNVSNGVSLVEVANANSHAGGGSEFFEGDVPGVVNSLAFDPSGKYLVSGGKTPNSAYNREGGWAPGTPLVLWDATSLHPAWDASSLQWVPWPLNKTSHGLKTTLSDIDGVAFSPDGTHIVACGGTSIEDYEVFSLDGEPLETAPVTVESAHGGGKVRALAFSPDGSKLISGGRQPPPRSYSSHPSNAPWVERGLRGPPWPNPWGIAQVKVWDPDLGCGYSCSSGSPGAELATISRYKVRFLQDPYWLADGSM